MLGITIPCFGCNPPPEGSSGEWRKRTEEMGIIEEVRVTGVGRNVNGKNGICSIASTNGLTDAIFAETRVVACAYIVRMHDGVRIMFAPKRARGDYQERVDACTLKRSGGTVMVNVSRWFEGDRPKSVFYETEGFWGDVVFDPSVASVQSSASASPPS